jgi:signal transduction histidine kinase/ABC-type amino acid transport substrate-binding protein
MDDTRPAAAEHPLCATDAHGASREPGIRLVGWAGRLLLVTLLLLTWPTAHAERLVRVGVYENSPKVALSPGGQPEGVFIDLIEAIAEREGWRIDYVPGSWAEGLDRLAAGSIDLMPDVALTPERQRIYAFHEEPVLSSWVQVYARTDSSIRSLLDLTGKRVAVLERSVQQNFFSHMVAGFGIDVELVERPDFDAAFDAVRDGQADAVVTNRFFGARHAAGYGLEDTAIIFSPSKLYFAAPQHGRHDLLLAVDRHLREFKRDSSSVYYTSLGRWIASDVHPPRLPAWLPGAALAVVALILAGVGWVVVLRTQVSAKTAEIRARSDELLVINRTLRATGSRLELDAVLDETMQGALSLTGFDGGVLCLRDPAEKTLTVGATYNGCASGNPGPMPEAICPAMLEGIAADGKPVLLDARSPEGTPRCCGNTHDDGVRWNALFPLRVRDDTIGILCLYSRKEAAPEPRVLGLVEDLCGPVALAMENARLYAQVRRHAHELEGRVQERTEALAKANHELLEAKHAAESADRLKSAFLATMSHELRTPLNSIIGFTGIILQGLAGPLTDEQSKQLGMVRDSARHLLALINDVLDISKIEADELVMANERFDLRASIAKVTAIAQPLAQKKNLALQVALAPDVDFMHGDARRVEQILLNLISNAIKFTETGTVEVTAKRAQAAPDHTGIQQDTVCVNISDTGMGIREEDMNTLFKPFRQIDSALSRAHEGTGLGLAICQRLATLMGGAISVSSRWGQGSVFTVTLPLEATAIRSPA